MSSEKAVKFFSNIAMVAFYVLMFTNAASAQVQIQGQGGNEIMMYVSRIVQFAFYLSITGCLGSVMFAGYKFSTGHQQGMDQVKAAIIGTAIVAAASGILHYWVFAAQDTGLGNTNGPTF